jgi:erythromycin esterase
VPYTHLANPGFTVVTAVGVSKENSIGEPEAGTLEARLTATPGPVRFIPAHQRQGLPVSEITALLTRSLSAKNPTYVAGLSPQTFTDFDWWAVLDSTTYTRGGPPLPE